MAEEIKKPPSKKGELGKRELKSVKRKQGVPILKKKPKKTKIWWYAGAVVVVALILAVIFVPKIGTIRYGICKTYIEMHDPYPESLEYVQAYENGNLVSIDFNRIDSFGQRSLNQMRCVFKTDTNPNEIATVDLNGKSYVYPLEAQDEIDKFNTGVPALMQKKPSLVMPKGLPEDIKKYR